MNDHPRPFRVSLRGYDPVEVDRAVTELSAQLQSARGEAAGLRHRIEELERHAAESAEPAPVEEPSFEHLGERVAQILRLADEEAQELRQRALVEAAEVQERAEQAAARVRDEADRYDTARRSEADTEATRVLENARRAADERLDAAERDAATRLQEAEAVFEAQRAKAAKSSADFETTLAHRRKMAEEEFAVQMDQVRERLAAMEREVEETRARAQAERTEAARESRRLVEEAEQHAAALVEDAKASADRIRADSERELAAASQRRDAINAQLSNVRQMLATLTGGVAAGQLTAAEPTGDVDGGHGDEGEATPAEEAQVAGDEAGPVDAELEAAAEQDGPAQDEPAAEGPPR